MNSVIKLYFRAQILKTFPNHKSSTYINAYCVALIKLLDNLVTSFEGTNSDFISVLKIFYIT